MAEYRRIPRLEEDLHFDIVSEPPDYPHVTESPVRYVQVVSDRGVLGYLWVSERGDAIDYLPRRAAGARGFNVAGGWVQMLRALYAQGISAAQAFDELLGWKSTYHHVNRPDPASLRTLPSLAALKELAEQV